MTGPRRDGSRGQGFILANALAIMALLSIMGIGLYYRSQLNQVESSSDWANTQAFYFAETAINYVTWALKQDANLDGLDPDGDSTTGDWSELVADTFRPGPLSQTGTEGQLAYFDNRKLSDRGVWRFIDANNQPTPDWNNLDLPRHLKIEIDTSTGDLTLTPPVSSPTPSSVNANVPTDGAVVWLTAALVDPTGKLPARTDGQDIHLDNSDTDLTNVCGSVPGAMTNPIACICNSYSPNCSGGEWFNSYGIVAYAIAYVHGKPRRMLRSVIATLWQ